MSKFIFITGGVLSGVGKGVAVASVANLLKAANFSVFILKLDPYLNVDPGVLSPYEHGEVYVTSDGGETDLDLGHYERFTNQNFSKDSNHTTGKILLSVIEKERRGEYKGKTVQWIPNVTDEIMNYIKGVAQKHKTDFVLVEIGGTVGDMESNPFYFAASQMGAESNYKNTFFIHTTYVPFLSTSQDFKTKPTQFSIANLNTLGIKPNLVFVRLDSLEVDEQVCQKVAKSSWMSTKNVIAIPNLPNIYSLPEMLKQSKVLEIILEHFNLENVAPDLRLWNAFNEKMLAKKEHSVKIAALGKYIEFKDAYKSILEALNFAGAYNNCEISLDFIDTSGEHPFDLNKLKEYSGALILPGFGYRGFEIKVAAAMFLHANNIPTFGICLGMQAMTVAYARYKGISNANSAEFLKEQPNQTSVLDYNKENGHELQLGGTLRLGSYDIQFVENSKIAQIYKNKFASERHRHRFEVVKKYINTISDDNFYFSGFEKHTGLVESCEDKTKDFYIGVQYHPEFESKPLSPHPLFDAFIKVILKQSIN